MYDVSTPSPEAIIQEVITLAHQPEWESVQAIAVAGSHARNDADQFSDLDLFVLLSTTRTRDVPSHGLRFVGCLQTKPTITRGPVFVPEFGFSMTLLYENLQLCQLNFNNADTYAVSPMRATSRILLDRTGWMTSMVKTSTTISIDFEAEIALHSDYYVLRLLYGARAFLRGEHWAAITYLGDVRRAMMSIKFLLEGDYNVRIHRHMPQKRLELLHGGPVAKGFETVYPRYSQASISEAISAAVIWYVQNVPKREGSQTDPYHDLVTKIGESVKFRIE